MGLGLGGFGGLLSFEAILDTFIISPCDTPPPHQTWFEFFFIYFWSFKGKNENVIDLPKNHFKDVKKLNRVPIACAGTTMLVVKLLLWLKIIRQGIKGCVGKAL